MANDIPDDIFKRMVLANQYRMLAVLDRESAERWLKAVDMTLEGWPAESLPDVDFVRSYIKDALTREDQHFVLDALNVFELVQDGIKAGYKPMREHAIVQFPGFDGNNETKLMSYARHVVEGEGRFEYVERSAKDFNAHMPTVELYQRMISAWERWGRKQQVDQPLFDALIDAQMHPGVAQLSPNAGWRYQGAKRTFS